MVLAALTGQHESKGPWVVVAAVVETVPTSPHKGLEARALNHVANEGVHTGRKKATLKQFLKTK